MLFPTVTFAVFFVVAFTASWLTRPFPLRWRLTMTAASFVFYGWWSWRYVGLLGASILGNWAFGWATARAMPLGRPTATSRWTVRVAVAANLALLGWFKYAEWLVVDVWNPLPFGDVDAASTVAGIVLPVGISFFTFQAMSYVIDIGRGHQEPISLSETALFLSFFPQLVAGPIVRASELIPQARRRADPRRVRSAPAFRLIAAGLFKKVVVSSYLADQIVDPVFGAPAQHSAWEVFWAVLGYAVQIYADFSGYTDIAIGCALLLGFRFPQNFDAPYTAVSLQDFWRRWHMTLSRWLRDYLYIPLGGNRGGVGATYRNLALTMLLGGLWHGAAWTFVIWGAIHGGVLALERWRAYQPHPVLGRLRTFAIVCVAWVFFRAPTFGDALGVLGRLVTGWGGHAHAGASLVNPVVVLAVVGMLATQFVPLRAVLAAQAGFARLHLAAQAAMLGVGLLAIDTLGPEGVAPFIYFQF